MSNRRAMQRGFQLGTLILGGGAIALLVGSVQVGCGGSNGTGAAGTGGSAAGSTGNAGTGGGAAGMGGEMAGTGGGMAGTGGAGASTACRNDAIEVTADITTNTTWACNTYVLKQKVHIDGGSTIATLTIMPGSTIYGAGSPSSPAALISTRNGRLNAVGTATAPITFTSSALPGNRMPGDTFAGVVLLGKAGLSWGSTCQNDPNPATSDCEAPGYFQAVIEGIPADDARGQYGGTDNDWNCGDLRYVRIQFAGYIIGLSNELNGLTVGGCGAQTKLSYIHVHRGFDDGVEFFGGTANIDHLLVSGSVDDGLDWDQGWRGKAQFLIVHQSYGTGDKGFEADNYATTETVTPRSNPEIWNATLIGQTGLPAQRIAMHLRRGTWYKLRNFIVYGFGNTTQGGAVDVESSVTLAGNDPKVDWPTNISIESSVIYGLVSPPEPMEACAPAMPATCAAGNNDLGFDETAMITAAARMNTTDMDPMFPAGLNGATISASPSYVPGNAAAVTGKATPGTGFDATATYAGAVAPGTAAGSAWYDGWTEFPAN